MRDAQNRTRREAAGIDLPLRADIAVDSRIGGGKTRHVYYAVVVGTARSAGRVTVIEPEGPQVRQFSLKEFAARYVPLPQCPPGVREKCRGILDYAAWLAAIGVR